MSRNRAFTLVELLIALGLMAVLVTAVSQVFSTAQQVFAETDAKVLLYQNMRVMFDTFERDLANTEKTYQMEFFDDSNPNDGIFNGPAEEITDLEQYDYAPTFTQATYTDREGEIHRADEMYFRTLTTFRGKTRVVLVHYELRYEDDAGNVIPLPVLERKLRYVEEATDSGITLNDEWEIGGRFRYLTDFQVQMFYHDRRERLLGHYQSPGPLVTDPEHRLSQYGSEPNKIVCMYWGENDGTILFDSFLEEHYMRSQSNNRFGLLSPGDKMLLTYNDPANPGPDVAKSLTIREIYEEASPPNNLLIYFNESLELPNTTTSLPTDYLGAWLPPSLKITARIKNASARKGKGVRIVSRIFRLLRA